VLLSVDEYDRLKRRNVKVGLTAELPDERIKAVEEARIPEEYATSDGDDAKP
jgi:hypothetical protein